MDEPVYEVLILVAMVLPFFALSLLLWRYWNLYVALIVAAGLIYSVWQYVDWVYVSGDGGPLSILGAINLAVHWFFFCMCAYGLWGLIQTAIRRRRKRRIEEG